MSLYLKQLEQLVALQRVDHEIFDIHQELKEAPQEVEVLEKRFNDLEVQRLRLLDKISHIKDQEKRLNLEIDEDAQRIKKRKSQMMTLENGRDYHAMAREMDNMEKVNRSREEEKVLLMEELTRQDTAFKELDETYQAVKADLEEKKNNLQTRIDAANAVLDDLKQRRHIASNDVPPPIFARYEFIRQRLDHPVIVGVKDGICSGCHIAIPPQAFIELQKGQQILSCPNCQRLIFWCEHFSSETETEAE